MPDVVSFVLLFGIPAAAVVFAIISVVKFLRLPKNSEKRKLWKALLIVSVVIAALAGGAILAFSVILMSAIMYM